MRAFSQLFKRFVFLFTGTLRSTDWLGQSQLKYLPWSSWNSCESSLLFYLVLIEPLSILVFFVSHLPTHIVKFFFQNRELQGNSLLGTIQPQISTLTKLTILYAQKWHIH